MHRFCDIVQLYFEEIGSEIEVYSSTEYQSIPLGICKHTFFLVDSAPMLFAEIKTKFDSITDVHHHLHLPFSGPDFPKLCKSLVKVL